MVLVGLLGRPGAGTCPNLPQRRSGPGSAAKKSAEYQRFFLRAPTRSGPLWQIWTRTGSGPGPTGPTRPARPICLRFRFSPPLPGPNMAPREDRSGAHPTARPSEPRNHAETDGHTRGGARTILPGRQNRVRALGPARPRPRHGAPVQQIRTHPAPQAPYAPPRHTQNNLPGRRSCGARCASSSSSTAEPFSSGRRRCSGAGSAPRSATTATGPLLRRDVHLVLENDG